jgi:hypothetical protein
MTTERLMMRLKLARMGLDPRIHQKKILLSKGWIAGSSPIGAKVAQPCFDSIFSEAARAGAVAIV